MATFKSVENDNGLMAKGDYEVYVKAAQETETEMGNPCIKFDFVVRSDVEQPYQNKHIFKNFYPDRLTNAYPAVKIGKYANSLGIEKGQEFELEDLVGRNCILHISHFTCQDGVTRECILYTDPSKVEPYMAPMEPTPQMEELDEEETLPF